MKLRNSKFCLTYHDEITRYVDFGVVAGSAQQKGDAFVVKFQDI